MSASAPNLSRISTGEEWLERKPNMVSIIIQDPAAPITYPRARVIVTEDNKQTLVLPFGHKTITINHELFPKPVFLVPVGTGASNIVYSIVNTDYVLKMPKAANDNKPEARKDTLRRTLQEMELSAQHGIPYPTCLINPRDYKPLDIEGGFFVMEKLAEEVEVTWEHKTRAEWSEKEIKVLDLVRSIFKLHWEVKREIAQDFFPRNVMFSKEGDVKVVDFIHHDKSLNSLLHRTSAKIYVWCMENQEAIEYVTKGIPQEHLGVVLEHYKVYAEAERKNTQQKTGLTTPPQSPRRNPEPQLTPKRQRI